MSILYLELVKSILYLNEVLLLGAKDVGYPRQRFQSITNKRLTSKYCSLLFCNPNMYLTHLLICSLTSPISQSFQVIAIISVHF